MVDDGTSRETLSDDLAGASSPRTGWSAAIAVVAALAIVVWVLTWTAPGSSNGSGPAPRATATAESIADGLLRDWNSGNATTAAMYARTAEARFAIDKGDYTETYIGQAAIANEIASRAAIGFTVTRTGDVIHQGDYLAFPLIWETAAGKGEGVAILQVNAEGQVQRQWVLGATAAAPARQSVILHAGDGSVEASLDDHRRAVNAHDGAAAIHNFAEDGEWRIALGSGDWTEVYVGSPAIAAATAERATTGFAVARTGSMVRQGSFVVHPWTSTSTAGSGQGIAVFRLIPTWGTAIQDEWEIGN